MDLNEMYNFFHMMIFSYPFVSMGIVASLGILIYFKPKEVIRVLAIFAAILVIIYLLTFLTQATKIGFIQKDKLVHQDNPDSD